MGMMNRGVLVLLHEVERVGVVRGDDGFPLGS